MPIFGECPIYQKDSKNETHFIGEQKIDNIPTDENVTLKIGTLSPDLTQKHHKKLMRFPIYGKRVVGSIL